MKARIEKVRRELKELGGLKVEGEGEDYNAARDKLFADLDKLLHTVAAALSKREPVYEEFFVSGDFKVTEDEEEVLGETLDGFALIKFGKRSVSRSRVTFNGEIVKKKNRFVYRVIVNDVEAV
ncbi:MAG: hypothetical protein NZ954_08220 [Thermofilaceae archaeon]|nr:hypothetical protein [Thermofilaceae archaeon]MDW8004953.1 hypothetical protein [Thermofilaceae archaeon]